MDELVEDDARGEEVVVLLAHAMRAPQRAVGGDVVLGGFTLTNYFCHFVLPNSIGFCIFFARPEGLAQKADLYRENSLSERGL